MTEALHDLAEQFSHDSVSPSSPSGVLWTLYGLVRLARPEMVVEAGSGYGVGTCFLIQAVVDNGYGEVWSYEIDPDLRQRTQDRIDGQFGANVVSRVLGDFYTDEMTGTDFLYLDIDPKKDYVRAFERVPLTPNAIVCAHDTHSVYIEDTAAPFVEHLKSIGWECVDLPFQRGLLVARRKT